MPKKNKLNKSEFVRSLPLDLPVELVIGKAKEAGISMSKQHVYNVRNLLKAKTARTKAAKPAPSSKGKVSKGKVSRSVKGKTSAMPPVSDDGKPKAADFVRSLPVGLPVAEVMTKARAAGYTFPPGFVALIRSAGKRKGKPAKAKAGRKSGKATASAFIRTLPAELTVKEVVAQGKANGFTIQPSLVYRVRGSKKGVSKRTGKPTRKYTRAAAAPTVSVAKAPSVSAAADDHKHTFRRLMIRLGLDQTEALFGQVRAELRAIENRG